MRFNKRGLPQIISVSRVTHAISLSTNNSDHNLAELMNKITLPNELARTDVSLAKEFTQKDVSEEQEYVVKDIIWYGDKGKFEISCKVIMVQTKRRQRQTTEIPGNVVHDTLLV